MRLCFGEEEANKRYLLICISLSHINKSYEDIVQHLVQQIESNQMKVASLWPNKDCFPVLVNLLVNLAQHSSLSRHESLVLTMSETFDAIISFVLKDLSNIHTKVSMILLGLVCFILNKILDF